MVPGTPPTGGDPPVPAVVVEPAGEALVLRTEADAGTPIHELAAALPPEAGRRAVVSAPSVTARPDLFELLLEALTEHLGGVATGIRLVPIGAYAPSVDPRAEAGLLAEWIGQDVAVPPTALAVPAGGALAPAPWVGVDPDGAVRAEPPWPAVPPLAVTLVPVPPPAVTLAPIPPPAVTAASRWPHAILRANGGYLDLPARRPRLAWKPPRPAPRVRPPGTPETGTDTPGTLPGTRTPSGWSFVDEPTVGNARCLAGFVVEIEVQVTGFRVAGRPVAPRALAKLLDACRAGDTRPLVFVTSGVPVRGPAADLLFGGLADALATPVYAADGAVTRTATGLLQTAGAFLRWSRREPGATRTARRGRLVGPVLPARPPARTRRPDRGVPRPAPAPRTAPTAGAASRTAAPGAPGAPTLPGDPPAPPALPTPLGPETAALLASGRWPAPPRLAVPPQTGAPPPADVGRPGTGPAALDAAPIGGPGTEARGPAAGWGDRPPVPAPPSASGGAADGPPTAAPARPRSGQPEETPGQPGEVPTAVGPGWQPGPSLTAAALGPSAPIVGSDVPRASDTPGADGASASGTTASGPADKPPAPPTGTEPAGRPSESTAPPAPAPRWLTAAGLDSPVADRTALRQALGGRYDAYARVVARTLAQSPGLRTVAGASGELTAGLVAVRAYCDGERDRLNEFLRGGGPETAAAGLTLVARAAAYGLRRLPSVLGPVFRAGPDDPRLAGGYRPGDVLVEPAFVDVDLTAGANAAPAGTRLLIWSVSARRLDGLDGGTGASAVFPPGSRFQVLAVDDGAPGREVRVLLRDLAASARGGPDSAERVLQRLRAADQGGPASGGAAVPPSFAPGLDDAGRPFPAPASAGAIVADEDGRA
ncbi:hypothetical protein AB0J86_22415 [Micromonospora sp. NPDC049559]|uniref:hypothetical protein n=1 Tax=Micromonospora sp. NPDC049559 TaxID=3155923 RepID=UPI003430860C